LFYFAGHGIALDSDDGPHGYLVPVDACLEDKTSLLSMHTIYQALHALPCRHLLAILDCCFAGAFRWSTLRDFFPIRERLYQEQFVRFVQDPAWQVITSADYDQKALDYLTGDSFGERGDASRQGIRHSPFALALFDALEGNADISPPAKDGQPAGDGIITATELLLYLREHVEYTTQNIGNRQTPMLWPLQKHDKGEYVFAVPGYGEPQLLPAPALSTANNPYRGLLPFAEEDTNLFFGRQTLIRDLTEKVIEGPLAVVLGASGSGKSSLVRAGLFPQLRMRQADEWLLLPPMRPTEKPLTVLTNLLSTLSTGVGQPATNSRNDKALASFTLLEQLETVIQSLQLSPQRHLLLFIDQFEELITQCDDECEREHFMALLAALVQIDPVNIHIVLTLRSDFESQFANESLAPYWHAARFVVTPMSRSELREVVEGPAKELVLFFEPAELVDQIIDEVIQSPGILPLLSFTLSELYLAYLTRNSKNRALTQEDYEKLGGVIGSLRFRAMEEYKSLSVAEQATMRRVLLRMVSLESSELTRRRVPLTELEYPDVEENQRVHKIVEQLTNRARLLVKGSMNDGTDKGEAYVEPAHDALVQGWDMLLVWVREAKEYLPLQRRLNQAAIDWESRNYSPDHLWHNEPRLPQLQQVLRDAQQFAEDQLWQIDTISWQIRQSLWPSIAAPSNPTWFNKKETAFVQQSILRKASE
ncbi:MAG: NACHT domain-containing protein, partial [Caldilineaceae bacterium]|nr:NACHT domain-containing protein [Caldilineaceae bacterium]